MPKGSWTPDLSAIQAYLTMLQDLPNRPEIAFKWPASELLDYGKIGPDGPNWSLFGPNSNVEFEELFQQKFCQA